jgi:hypothetical protein
MSLYGVRINYVGIGVAPQPRVLPIRDFLCLTERDLMRYLIFLIGLIIITEGVISFLQSQVLRQFKVKPCLFCIDIAIPISFEGPLLVWFENGQSLYDKLIGQLQSIVANNGLLSNLHVTVIQCRCLFVVFLFN